MPVSYSAEVRAAALEIYHLDGPSAAAEKYGMDKGTVTRWAKKAGVTTVATSRTRAATEARSVTLRERRQHLAESLMDTAEHIVPRIRAPFTIYSFSPKDNSVAEVTLPEPPATDVRAFAGAIGTLMTQISKVIETEVSATTVAGKSMLERGMAAIEMLPFDPDPMPEEVIGSDDLFPDSPTSDATGVLGEADGVPPGQ